MKTINKIIGILGIALIAIATIGAVSAYETYDNGDDQPCIYDEDAHQIWTNIGAWDYTPCPEPSLPDVHADGNEVMLVGYFHSADFPKSFNVDDWNGYTAGEWTPTNDMPFLVK